MGDQTVLKASRSILSCGKEVPLAACVEAERGARATLVSLGACITIWVAHLHKWAWMTSTLTLCLNVLCSVTVFTVYLAWGKEPMSQPHALFVV